MTFSIKLALIIFAFAIVVDLLWLGVFEVKEGRFFRLEFVFWFFLDG